MPEDIFGNRAGQAPGVPDLHLDPCLTMKPLTSAQNIKQAAHTRCQPAVRATTLSRDFAGNEQHLSRIVGNAWQIHMFVT